MYFVYIGYVTFRGAHYSKIAFILKHLGKLIFIVDIFQHSFNEKIDNILFHPHFGIDEYFANQTGK